MFIKVRLVLRGVREPPRTSSRVGRKRKMSDLSPEDEVALIAATVGARGGGGGARDRRGGRRAVGRLVVVLGVRRHRRERGRPRPRRQRHEGEAGEEWGRGEEAERAAPADAAGGGGRGAVLRVQAAGHRDGLPAQGLPLVRQALPRGLPRPRAAAGARRRRLALPRLRGGRVRRLRRRGRAAPLRRLPARLAPPLPHAPARGGAPPPAAPTAPPPPPPRPGDHRAPFCTTPRPRRARCRAASGRARRAAAPSSNPSCSARTSSSSRARNPLASCRRGGAAPPGAPPPGGAKGRAGGAGGQGEQRRREAWGAANIRGISSWHPPRGGVRTNVSGRERAGHRGGAGGPLR